jgi:hypothetical protein
MIQREKPREDFLVGKVGGPAVGGENRFIQSTVGVGEPLRAGVVELGEGALSGVFYTESVVRY